MKLQMRTLVSLSLAAALAGCSLAPTYERPDAPVSSAYPAGPAYKADAAGPVATADIGWRDFFADPLLQQLIEQSLANNRDLRVAALNVEAARAQYRIQRADLLPSVGIAGKETAQRTPADLSPSGQASTSHNYQVGAALSSWELDLFGRIRSLSDKALESYLALDETRTATQLTLIAEVANAYLTLRADQELLSLTRDTLKSQDDSYKLTKQSFDQGLSTALDLSQAEVSLRTAQRNLSQYTRQAAQDRNALVLLVGQPLSPEISAALDNAIKLDDGMLPTALPAGLPSELLARRPDIRAAEHQLKGANANIGAARAAFFPTISLTGLLGVASPSLDTLFKGGQGYWSFSPSITTPLFAGGSIREGLNLARARDNIAVAQYEQTIQQAFREVSDALAGEATYGAQLDAQRALQDSSARTLELSNLRYTNGVDSYLQVQTAQVDFFNAQLALVQTGLAALINRVELYKALGGGWEETTKVQ